MTGKTIQKKKIKKGRPTVFTSEVVTKIIAGFHNGFNDTEVCLYAQISRNAFYEELKRNKAFSDKITYAKGHPNMKAKELVITNINEGDVATAKWWLERKAKSEFSLRIEQTGKDGGSIANTVDIFGNALDIKEEEENDGDDKESDKKDEDIQPEATGTPQVS